MKKMVKSHYFLMKKNKGIPYYTYFQIPEETYVEGRFVGMVACQDSLSLALLESVESDQSFDDLAS